MAEQEEWQCSDCGTLIGGPETRKCPNCGGINFYPLADEVPGETHESGTIKSDITLDEALEHLSTDES
jgi:phage FluMu protein Com